MASNAWKWVLGCGAGCAVVILAIVALIVGAGYQVKRMVDRFEEAEAVSRQVTERFGRAEDFCPLPDGTIEAERIEAFLRAREFMAPMRESTEEILEALEQAEGGKHDMSAGETFKAVRSGFGLIPAMADFYRQRSESLLEAEIGLGEYLYIYVVTYYSWLGRSAADGPPFVLRGNDDGMGAKPGEYEVREMRLETMLELIHFKSLPWLQCQLSQLDAKDRDLAEWRLALEGEIAAMQVDPYRIPWRDGLPENLEASLEPYRERLEASYSPLCNPFEIAFH